MKPHRGTLILVLGILGFVGCGIFTGIPAWIMGNTDLKEMDAGTMDPTGRQLTTIGRILGMVSVALFAVGCVIWLIIFIIGMLGAAASSSG